MMRWGKLIEYRVECSRGHEMVLSGLAHPLYKGGGCAGHTDDEYCYCNSPYAELVWDCPKCPGKSRSHSVEL